MATPSTPTEQRDVVEINAGGLVHTVVFSANGEYLVSGGWGGLQVWRVRDGAEMTWNLVARNITCAAVSNDGRRIAAGSYHGDVYAWNAESHQQVFGYLEGRDIDILGVDLSPDATRLVSASSNGAASVWDVATSNRVLLLQHDCPVRAGKYSPQGDRIATATWKSVRVHDSNDGRLLVDVDVTVFPSYNNGLLWFNNHQLLVVSDRMKQLEASTGLVVSEWPVLASDRNSCICLPKHGKFVIHSTERTITFWATSTHAQFGLIQHPEDIWSIAVSPDDRLLAVCGEDGKIIIRNLSRSNSHSVVCTLQEKALKLSAPLHIANSFLLSPSDPTFQEPNFHVDDTALNLWGQDQLTDADASLTVEMTTFQNTSHHILASRALVRARLRKWDMALTDAEKAIDIQPSVVAYIIKSIALVGRGERDKGYRICDLAFARSHSSHISFLLLIKAILVFMAGEHLDAISRVDDLAATTTSNSVCYVVQAYMHLLLGNLRMECCDYEHAIESFERARAQMRHHRSQLLTMISLIFGWVFDNIEIMIRRRLCDAICGAGRTKDAVECFCQLINELGGEASLHGKDLEWALGFKKHSGEKLAYLGDSATEAQLHDEAISHYSTALSIDPQYSQDILIKRGRAFLATGSWKEALDDANQVIELNPSSPWGYQVKHAALHKAGEYDNAVNAFEVMLNKMAQSLDPDVRQCSDQYINPSTTRATIRKIVQRMIRHSPRILINTTTGRLRDRTEQASAFESLPIFSELVSSMTSRVDYVRIKREVREYFRYVMLSHKWENNEPLFQQVLHTGVYDLDKSPTHDKLQTFCKIVRDGGFDWAWSDTCCIDKSDHFVLQEALVAMFKWYQSSVMVIVFLRGVRSTSQLGALVRSIWNSRAWTLQEYIAAKVIHFYTEDWTLYLNLELPNHKESPEVISEMEQATGVSAEQLMSLRPGLTSIREKLLLASSRQTTLVEDAAYSLLGIFSVTGIPAIYGEGEGSLGRLLAHVLAGSGDVSIIAWTGESGSFNSCLPAHVTVFGGPATSHLPSLIPDTDMERIIANSSFDSDMALTLYDHLNELPAPWFAANRMKLPYITFQLPPLTPYRTRSGRLYRADTAAFGAVEITTKQDLSRMKSLFLVHPWLDALLEQEDAQSSTPVDDAPPPSPNIDDGEIADEESDDRTLPLLDTGLLSHATPEHTAPMDDEMRARRFVARLRQPFGALLLTSVASSRRITGESRLTA